jgi:cell division initiation protein
MDLSPQTLREVAFREKLRGYHPDDVDEFVERIASGLEILQERLRQAMDRAVRAEQKAAEVGEGDDAMRRTLVLAQRTADLAIQEAKDQAARIVAHAESQAQALRAEAADQARATVESATREARAEVERLEQERRRLDDEISTLDRYLDDERARVRDLLSQALRQVDAFVPSLTPRPAAASEFEVDVAGDRRIALDDDDDEVLSHLRDDVVDVSAGEPSIAQ